MTVIGEKRKFKASGLKFTISQIEGGSCFQIERVKINYGGLSKQESDWIPYSEILEVSIEDKD